MTGRCTLFANTRRTQLRGRKRVPKWNGRFGRIKQGVEWQDVWEICCFWDGSCRTLGCGAGIRVNVVTQALGVAHREQKAANKRCATNAEIRGLQ